MRKFGKTIKPRKFGNLVSIQASVRPIVQTVSGRWRKVSYSRKRCLSVYMFDIGNPCYGR